MPTASSLQSSTNTQHDTFHYPAKYHFPPFFNLQPNLTTRAAQLSSWSALVLSYCATYRIFRLSSSHTLFSNPTLRRRLPPDDVKVLFAFMADRGRAEYTSTSGAGNAKKADGAKVGDEVWVWWKTPDEWAGEITKWIEDTGQKGAVLTFYELREGEATVKEAFHGLPPEVLTAVLNVLVARGKATVWGEDDNMGVKFY